MDDKSNKQAKGVYNACIDEAVSRYNKSVYLWGKVAYNNFKVDKTKCDLEYERLCALAQEKSG